MPTHTRIIDQKGRITLPKAYAGATVLIEEVSDTELRIRKARVVAEDELKLAEENIIRLSPADWKRFLEVLDNPPKPNAALKRLLRKGRPRR